MERVTCVPATVDGAFSHWLRVIRDEDSIGIAEVSAADKIRAAMTDRLDARISTIGVIQTM